MYVPLKRPICYAPFVSTFIDTMSTRACCRNFEKRETSSNGDFNKDWNSEHYKKLRRAHIGDPKILIPDSCKSCLASRDNSIRNGYEPKNRPMIADTYNRNITGFNYTDGSLKESNLSSITLSPSNECNLACRMCYGSNSNTYYRKNKDFMLNHNGMIDILNIENDYIIKTKTDIISVLKNNLETLDEVIFHGGEPMLTSVFPEVIKTLLPIANRIRFLILSNGTTVKTLENKRIDYYLKKFKHLLFTFSIDGGKVINEFIRRGTNQERMYKNIFLIKKWLPNADINIHLTLTNISAMGYKDYFNEVLLKFKDLISDISIEHLVEPSHLKVNNLPNEVKSDILEDMSKLNYNLMGKFKDKLLIQKKDIIADMINAKNHDEWESFKRYMKNVYVNEKIDIFKIFPNLIKYIEI